MFPGLDAVTLRAFPVSTCLQDRKAVKEPTFSTLAYADSGLYVCEVSMTGLVRRQSFHLIVEGQQLLHSPGGLKWAQMSSRWTPLDLLR